MHPYPHAGTYLKGSEVWCFAVRGEVPHRKFHLSADRADAQQKVIQTNFGFATARRTPSLLLLKARTIPSLTAPGTPVLSSGLCLRASVSRAAAAATAKTSVQGPGSTCLSVEAFRRCKAVLCQCCQCMPACNYLTCAWTSRLHEAWSLAGKLHIRNEDPVQVFVQLSLSGEARLLLSATCTIWESFGFASAEGG